MSAITTLPLSNKNNAETPSKIRATIISFEAVNLLIAEINGIRPASCISPRPLASDAAIAVDTPAQVIVGT